MDLYSRNILMTPEIKENEYRLNLSAYSNVKYILKVI